MVIHKQKTIDVKKKTEKTHITDQFTGESGFYYR